MNSRWQYTLAEFWEDLRSVNLAKQKWSLTPPLDVFVKNHFESIYGKSYYVTWRYGKFMLVMIYLANNKAALDVGDLSIAGTYDSLVSDKLCDRILNYAVTFDLAEVSQFPPPEFFLE